MLHNVYYIIKPNALQQTVQVGADAVIVLDMEPGSRAQIMHSYQLAENYLKDIPFCLLINLQNSLTSEQATSLIAFLFFSNYHKPGSTPLIIIGGENMASIKPGIEQLQQTAGEQGFSTINITLASALPIVFEATGQPAISETYQGWLQSPVTTTAALYIRVNKPADINAVHQALAAEETLFNQQNPGLFALKFQNRELGKQVQELELLCKAAQQEISNQVSHNQILRSSSQATALQNYYNNEYEVLPLWFKRLGHVVKALMGKRSVRSLYSDKVKKYKD